MPTIISMSINRQSDTDEWIVGWTEDFIPIPNKFYFTNDREDAIATREAEGQRLLKQGFIRTRDTVKTQIYEKLPNPHAWTVEDEC